MIPLPIIPIVPSSSFTDFPLSTITSSSSSLSDDTVIQIHHDFDEDIQEFPNAIDPSIPSTALDAPNQSSSAPGQPSIVPKRSTRPSRPPLYLEAYHCNQVTSTPIPVQSNSALGTSHLLRAYLSYDNLSPAYKTFFCSISTITKPTSYHQAVGIPKGQEAMDAKIEALEANNIWTLPFHLVRSL